MYMTGLRQNSNAKKDKSNKSVMTLLKNFSDYDLQALLDNELDEQEKNHVLNFIKNNPSAKKRFEELLKQKNILKKWYKSKG